MTDYKQVKGSSQLTKCSEQRREKEAIRLSASADVQEPPMRVPTGVNWKNRRRRPSWATEVIIPAHPVELKTG